MVEYGAARVLSRTRLASALAAGLLVGMVLLPSLSSGSAAAAAPAQLNLQLVWSRTLPGVTFLESSVTPAMLTTSADVVGGVDGKVYAFDAATGADEPGWPVQTTDGISSTAAAADVDGNGHDQIFIGSGIAASTEADFCSGGGTYSFEYTGAVRWHNIGTDADCDNQPFHSSFVIGDTTSNGQPDATIGALGLQSPSYNAINGQMNPGWPFFTDDTVFSTPALANLQGAGLPDIVMGGDASPGVGSHQGGEMRAITGTGQLLWQYNTDEQVRSSPAIGSLDGTGLSIVFGTGNFWQMHGGATDSDYIFVLNAGGQLKWKKDLGGVTQAAPALADVDGTGQPDIIEGTSGSVSDPNSGLVWVLDAAGNPLPNWAGVASGGGVVIGGISTADLNGDGTQDLLVPTGAGVFVYDGKTARQIGGLDIGQVGFQNTPLVTDDPGGGVDITVAGTQPNGTGVVQEWRVAGGQLGAMGWPMFHHDAQHTGNLSTVAPACLPAAAATAPTGVVRRLDGANRDATGVTVSQSEFPKRDSAGAVVLASNAAFPDALAGGPLAGAKDGPLLITNPSGLDPLVEAEIKRVLLPLRTVYVLGGTSAVSTSVDSKLRSDGFAVTRLDGTDRFGTAVAVAGALGNPTTVFEVTGLNFPDGLAAGPAAAAAGGAILLTDGAAQASATAAYLAGHAGTHYAIGGPAAQADPSATAVTGSDRYATAIDVASTFFPSPPAAGFATGAAFADALTGGPRMAASKGPLLLVPGCGALPSDLAGYLSTIPASVKAGLLFGGPSAVGDDVLTELDKALG